MFAKRKMHIHPLEAPAENASLVVHGGKNRNGKIVNDYHTRVRQSFIPINANVVVDDSYARSAEASRSVKALVPLSAEVCDADCSNSRREQ